MNMSHKTLCVYLMGNDNMAMHVKRKILCRG